MKAETVGAIFGVLLIVVIVGLVLWLRADGPCWIWPLKEAPTRCIVVGGQR